MRGTASVLIGTGLYCVAAILTMATKGLAAEVDAGAEAPEAPPKAQITAPSTSAQMAYTAS